MDGALRQLGYPPPSPRELRALTMRVVEAASAEALVHRVEDAMKHGKAVEMTDEEGRWFEELSDLACICPGCGQGAGQYHLDNCPCDPANTGSGE